MYSLYACSLSQSISIIAVEPAPNNLKYLIENIGLNSFSARFTVISNPLASRVFNGTLVNPDQRPGASGAQVQDVFSSAGHEITTVTGDLLVQKNGLNDGILKIDVDGNEMDILLGFERSLKEKRFRSVLVELTEFNFNEINLFMLECGLVEDLSYRTLPLHSDSRRKANGKSESNTVFTLR